jgi:hypothetical protein
MWLIKLLDYVSIVAANSMLTACAFYPVVGIQNSGFSFIVLRTNNTKYQGCWCLDTKNSCFFIIEHQQRQRHSVTLVKKRLTASKLQDAATISPV